MFFPLYIIPCSCPLSYGYSDDRESAEAMSAQLSAPQTSLDASLIYVSYSRLQRHAKIKRNIRQPSPTTPQNPFHPANTPPSPSIFNMPTARLTQSPAPSFSLAPIFPIRPLVPRRAREAEESRLEAVLLGGWSRQRQKDGSSRCGQAFCLPAGAGQADFLKV